MSSKRTIRPSPIPSGAEDIWKNIFRRSQVLDKPVPLLGIEILDTPFQRFGRNIFLFRRGYHDILELDLDFRPQLGRSVGNIPVLVHIGDHIVERRASSGLTFFPAFLFFEALGLLFLFVLSFPNVCDFAIKFNLKIIMHGMFPH